MYTTVHTVTKKDFISLLKSDRSLYAYIVITPDFGMNVKQSKSAWIQRVKDSNCEDWEIFKLIY